jgi:hypothetical protein
MNTADLPDPHYRLLFDVRRSIRYHDRRRAFFERMHRLTSVLTIVLAGGVLFELAGTGSPALWLQVVSLFAVVLAALDMVVGYAASANLHAGLRGQFAQLEIDVLSGGIDESVWHQHQVKRLGIEADEPPVYRALDLLCHNELLTAYGFKREKKPEEFATVSRWQRATAHFFHWPDIASR